MKWLRAITGFLFGELFFFLLVKLLSHATWVKLVGPYLAFAFTMALFLFLVWLVRRWRDNGKASSTQVAVVWGLCVAMFVAMVDASFVYLAFALSLNHLQISNDWGDLVDWGFAIVMTISCAAFFGYNAARRMGKTQPQTMHDE